MYINVILKEYLEIAIPCDPEHPETLALYVCVKTNFLGHLTQIFVNNMIDTLLVPSKPMAAQNALNLVRGITCLASFKSISERGGYQVNTYRPSRS